MPTDPRAVVFATPRRHTIASPDTPYVSTMEFEDQAAFMAWLKSDSFKASHSDDQAPGMQAPSGIESFDLIEDIVF